MLPGPTEISMLTSNVRLTQSPGSSNVTVAIPSELKLPLGRITSTPLYISSTLTSKVIGSDFSVGSPHQHTLYSIRCVQFPRQISDSSPVTQIGICLDFLVTSKLLTATIYHLGSTSSVFISLSMFDISLIIGENPSPTIIIAVIALVVLFVHIKFIC